MENQIKQLILDCGADVCGIAAIDRFASAPAGFSPTDIFAQCRSVIVFGIALPKGLAMVSPRLVYAHYNSLICGQVDAVALKGAKLLEQQYHACAVPMPCDSPYDYWEADTMTGRGLISMKHAAAAAGLGALGKNSMLLNARYGNMLTLGAILCDLPLQSDPLAESICIKGCSKCIDSCPVHAIGTDTVNQLLCRRNTYSKTARGFDTVECDRCRTVCPMRFGKG